MNRHIASIFFKHYSKQDTELVANATLLYYIHYIIVVFLALTLFMVFNVTQSKDQPAYIIITFTAVIGIAVATFLNLTGRFSKSLTLTIVLMIVIPWASILYEYFKQSGDYMPMLYMIIPIQIIAVFIPLKPMFIIATVQTVILTALILLDTSRGQYNWASVICYLFLASMLGTIISYMLRKQYITIVRSRNSLLTSEQKMREISIRDPLTGLYNRRYMNETFDRLAVERPALFSLLMVDIDHFKNINDTYGHTGGDEVIRKVADILVNATRQSDIVCRYGGDEFLMILLDCSPTVAMSKAQHIREEITNIVVEETALAPSVHITASIGVTHCSQNCTNIDDILKSVDTALYMAKQQGRNQVIAYNR